MESQRAKQLLEKYLNGTCTPEERIIFESWYNQEIRDREDNSEPVNFTETESRIYKNLPQPARSGTIGIKWIAAAAVAFMAIGIYFFKHNYNKAPVNVSVYANDIAPGSNKATLVLANGKTISLSNAKSGIVIKASQLTYNDGAAITTLNTKEAQVSTISTPRGGQYHVELPDGTAVVLNAASTLKFPSTFKGLTDRKVELNGEAYFEVSKDKLHPFKVVTEQQEVEVLGTHFNISSYTDEASVKTTLLEGSVKVTSLQGIRKSAILKPNQQSVWSANQFLVKSVAGKDAIAWKNGLFVFDDETLKNIMLKVARWYDVEVVYQGVDENELYWGNISRYDNISKLLRKLELTGGVHFKLEGRRVVVMK